MCLCWETFSIESVVTQFLGRLNLRSFPLFSIYSRCRNHQNPFAAHDNYSSHPSTTSKFFAVRRIWKKHIWKIHRKLYSREFHISTSVFCFLSIFPLNFHRKRCLFTIKFFKTTESFFSMKGEDGKNEKRISFSRENFQQWKTKVMNQKNAISLIYVPRINVNFIQSIFFSSALYAIRCSRVLKNSIFHLQQGHNDSWKMNKCW